MANKKKMPVKATESTVNPSTDKKSLTGGFRKASMTALLVIGIAIFSSIALFTALLVMAHTSNIKAANAEYESLREIADDVLIESDEFGMIKLSALEEEMLQINPDYVCWIRIDGTGVDYPVVRGNDNEKYLEISFHGEQRKTGTVFMDYRNYGDLLNYHIGENIPNIIIYGHNLQQGGIFSDLHKYLSKQFLENNRMITLIVNDQLIEFEIFSARLSDIQDPAYFLNFEDSRSFPRFANRIDAPLRATQIITLSTCTTGGSDDERLIIQGYRVV